MNHDEANTQTENSLEMAKHWDAGAAQNHATEIY